MIRRYAFSFLIPCFIPAFAFAQGETCASAMPVDPGTIVSDGPSSGEGASSDNANHADWFTWTAPSDGYVTIQSCGMSVDTRVFMYQGVCGSLASIAGNDDGCADGGSLMSNVPVTSGTTYHIEWDDLHSTLGFSWQFFLHTCPIIAPEIASGAGTLTLDWTVLLPGSSFTIEYGITGFEPGTGTIISGIQGEDGPPVTLPALNAGIGYQIWIAVDCGGGNTAPYMGPWYGTPGELDDVPNDDCETSIPIACGSITEGSTAIAIGDGPPECGTPISAPGVWYNISGVSGTVILSTCAAPGFDTKLNVYTGACDDLDCVDGNDDGAFGCYPGSEVIFTAQEDITYQVLVQGYDGAVGDFTLAMTCVACPPPAALSVIPTDTVAYLDWEPGNANGTFTVEYGPAGFAPGTGTVITGTVGVDGPPITLGGLALDTDYEVYLTETCPGGEDGYRRGPLAFTTLEQNLPVNAFCAGAVSLSCGQGATGNTALGVLAQAPECGSGFVSTPGLWYTFAGDGSDVTLSTCDNAEFDTKISVWSGTCSALVCEGGVDDAPGCGGNTSAVTIATSVGTTYFALVHGYDGGVGPFTITMACAPACTPALVNDHCSTAQMIEPQYIGMCVPIQGTNACAYTTAAPNPPCDPYSAAFDVWYAFNTGPSADHTITVELVTADFLGFAIYNGCGPGQFIDCYDQQAGPIALTGLELNTVYYLQIWNTGGDAAGTFTICDEAPVLVSVAEQAATMSLRAWPIPVEDVLMLDGLPSGSRALRVCDVQGRTVLTQAIMREGSQAVDMSALVPGAYVVRVEGDPPAAIRIVRR